MLSLCVPLLEFIFTSVNVSPQSRSRDQHKTEASSLELLKSELGRLGLSSSGNAGGAEQSSWAWTASYYFMVASKRGLRSITFSLKLLHFVGNEEKGKRCRWEKAFAFPRTLCLQPNGPGGTESVSNQGTVCAEATKAAVGVSCENLSEL